MKPKFNDKTYPHRGYGWLTRSKYEYFRQENKQHRGDFSNWLHNDSHPKNPPLQQS